MENSQILSAVNIMWSQIINGVGPYVVMSWGISKKQYTMYNDMPTLILQVSGLYHQGYVYVSYNGGADLYEVRLMTEDHKLKPNIEPYTDIYNDELGTLIDRLVERGTDSDEEYRKKALEDSERKICTA